MRIVYRLRAAPCDDDGDYDGGGGVIVDKGVPFDPGWWQMTTRATSRAHLRLFQNYMQSQIFEELDKTPTLIQMETDRGCERVWEHVLTQSTSAEH